METTQAITEEDVDLAPVFGALEDAVRERVLDELRGAEKALAELRGELGLDGGALAVQRYPSGQTEVAATLKGADGKLSFEAGLRPRNFFSEMPWQPGHAPRPMVTDAWDVDGAVHVMVRRPVGKHKYTIQETPEEIEEQRFSDPVEAAATLRAVCERLVELGRSREPTVDAWALPEGAA